MERRLALIYGINPVVEALRAGQVKQLRAVDRANARVAEVVTTALRDGIPVTRVSTGELDRASRGGVHQGLMAELKTREQFDLSDLVDGAEGAPLIVVLDGIEDPHNVGAILRTVDAAALRARGRRGKRPRRRGTGLDRDAVR